MKRVLCLILIAAMLSPMAFAAQKDGVFIPSYDKFIADYIERLEKRFTQNEYAYKDEILKAIKRDLVKLEDTLEKNSHFGATDAKTVVISVFETSGYLDSIQFSISAANYYKYMFAKSTGSHALFDCLVEEAIKALNEDWYYNPDILGKLNYYRIVGSSETLKTSTEYSPGLYTFSLSRYSGYYYFQIELGYNH